MKRVRWNRNTGKPYIRRSTGKERATGLRDAIKLAYYMLHYGRGNFYVMIQRRAGREIMTVGRTKSDIKGSLWGARRYGFNAWANRLKRIAQGR